VSHRPEVTGQAVESNQTIDEFCETEKISRSLYYAMKRDGTGPDELHAGNRRLITPEARRRWRRRRTVSVRRLVAQPDQSAT
jgi:hypothetical protein